MGWILVGAGGHAKVVVEAAGPALGSVTAYIDPCPAAWLDVPRIERDDDIAAIPPHQPIVMGLGGITTDQLIKRLLLFDRYQRRGHPVPAVVHPSAYVSPAASLGAGAIILTGAVIHPGVKVGRAVVVNTRAVIEHDTVVGDGAHLAPGAIVLGGARIGRSALIGAGAVVLPGAHVPDESLVPALTRFGVSA